MIHTIKIDGSYIPDGWVPVGFGHVRTGEHYIDKDGRVDRWGSMIGSYALYLIVEREIWEPVDGEEVWTFDVAIGVYGMDFQADLHQHISLKEKGFLFETEEQAQHAYNETLKLMEKLGETK